MVEIKPLTDMLIGGGEGLSSVTTFFLHTPFDEQYRGNEDYETAYRNYSAQGKQFLQVLYNHYLQLGGKSIRQRAKPEDYLIDTTDSQLQDKVLSGLKNTTMVPQDLVKTITARLDGGEGLVKIIESLQGKGIPGAFFDVVLEKLCQNLGQQCHEDIYDATPEGRIEESERLTLDVWFNAQSLQKYLTILGRLESLKDDMDAQKQRDGLANGLAEVLQEVIKKPTMAECRSSNGGSPECTLAAYMDQHGHLPVRQNSPLFRYRISELKDENKVPPCEIRRLLQWIHMSHQRLVEVQGNHRPVWSSEGHYPDECKRIDGTVIGNEIPFIAPRTIRGEFFKDSTGKIDLDMKYVHQQEDGLNLYWVPYEFLP